MEGERSKMLLINSKVSGCQKQHPDNESSLEQQQPHVCERIEVNQQQQYSPSSLGPATLALAKQEYCNNRKRQHDNVVSDSNCQTTNSEKRRSLSNSSQNILSNFNFDETFRAISVVLAQDGDDTEQQQQAFPSINWCFDDEK